MLRGLLQVSAFIHVSFSMLSLIWYVSCFFYFSEKKFFLLGYEQRPVCVVTVHNEKRLYNKEPSRELLKCTTVPRSVKAYLAVQIYIVH